MHDEIPIPLIDRLLAVASHWGEVNGRSLGALASRVVNHGSFFDRFEDGTASTTTATLEKFARFFLDPANWPGAVPAEAALFAKVVGVDHAAPDTAEMAGSSPGKAGAISPAAAA